MDQAPDHLMFPDEGEEHSRGEAFRLWAFSGLRLGSLSQRCNPPSETKVKADLAVCAIMREIMNSHARPSPACPAWGEEFGMPQTPCWFAPVDGCNALAIHPRAVGNVLDLTRIKRFRSNN